MKVAPVSLVPILVTSVFALPLAAEEEAKTNTSESKIDSILAAWDKDKSESLSKEELPEKMQQRMSRMDSNSDGRVTREELSALPQRAQERLASMAGGEKGGGGGSFKKEGEYYAPPAREEAKPENLKVGDTAPDFTLPRMTGEGDVNLLKAASERPVVLVFGSITCGPFRGKIPQTFELYQQYSDKADFYLVYIREAHPESTIYIDVDGENVLKKFTQTDTLGQRLDNANHCTALVGIPYPTLVDMEDNAVMAAYAGWPNRLVVVGTDGKIAYDSGKGPKGFQPDLLGQWLKDNL